MWCGGSSQEEKVDAGAGAARRAAAIRESGLRSHSWRLVEMPKHPGLSGREGPALLSQKEPEVNRGR